MGLRYEDLPAAIQEQIAKAGVDLGRKHDGISAPVVVARTLDRAKAGSWRCSSCSYVPKSWADAERHADKKRHHRIEVVLEEVPEP